MENRKKFLRREFPFFYVENRVLSNIIEIITILLAPAKWSGRNPESRSLVYEQRWNCGLDRVERGARHRVICRANDTPRR